MTNAQVWATLGILVGALGSMVTLTVLVVTRGFDGLRQEMSVSIDGLRQEMTVRFDGVGQRIDLLDRDVQKIAEKVFGG